MQTEHETQRGHSSNLPSRENPLRTIVLEFIGGSWDGRNLSNDTMDPRELELAVLVYLATGNGSVGMEIALPVDYASALMAPCGPDGNRADSADTEVFRVADCYEVGDEVLVRLEYSGRNG